MFFCCLYFILPFTFQSHAVHPGICEVCQLYIVILAVCAYLWICLFSELYEEPSNSIMEDIPMSLSLCTFCFLTVFKLTFFSLVPLLIIIWSSTSNFSRKSYGNCWVTTINFHTITQARNTHKIIVIVSIQDNLIIHLHILLIVYSI